MDSQNKHNYKNDLSNSHSTRLQWDIFCQVIDNLGDIGVSWRLARQLMLDYNQKVRLWVDDLHGFEQIAPQIKTDSLQQLFKGVEICQWLNPFQVCEPGDVVIEMFACSLPNSYVAKMGKSGCSPVWINLEYLSAEPWVPEYHGLRSPNPHLPLTKTFFFPGFVQDTGGLLREKKLVESIEAFDEEKINQFWQSIDVPQKKEHECRISLFCYEHAPLADLISIWIHSPRPVFLIVPEGKTADSVVTLLLSSSVQRDRIIQSGQLSVQVIPFLEQDHYDQLLWACDLNFVRGEDSFVRAQWAGKPFVWHIYPQSDNVHRIKLAAFLDVYTKHMPEQVALALRKFWYGWNAVTEINDAAWRVFLDYLEMLNRLNVEWRHILELQDDLASNLVQFVRNQL